MERVTGIGGLFFRSDDPDGLTRWYAEMLGVDPAPTAYGEPSWHQSAGPTVFAAMSPESEHFTGGRAWAVNFRVADLDAMVAQLREAGVLVVVDPAFYPNGRFADLHDPEGNPIQLWQPAGLDAAD
ncbi:VOC family protein [Microbacterium sp. P04]|uniref:VOC family protein n=1 Tax=Microbacterium sp. P04 TaxID=3366947 RepID=UPI0037474ECD